jgi:hypothetical protein
MTRCSCLILAALIAFGALACNRKASQGQSAEDVRVIARRIKAAKPPVNVAQVQSFFAVQEARARQFAARETGDIAPEVWPFFAAAKSGDWRGVTRLYYAMSSRSYQFDNTTEPDPQLMSLVWQPVNESFRFYEQCANGSLRHIIEYGQELIASLPPGAVLFAGTDASRFVVTALCSNHLSGDPIFVISQNALADGLYQHYLRTNSQGNLRPLTIEDSQRAFSDYIQDAADRANTRSLKPGENVRFTNGVQQVSGTTAVMEINARLARRLFDLNPEREFFVAEGYRLDWMQPLLEPHGFVLRVRRERVVSLSEEIIIRDRSFWAAKCDALLGDWLKVETSVATVCEFAEKVFIHQNLQGFTGDKDYVTSGPPWRLDPPYTSACLTYALARVSSAGIYERLAREATTELERRRLGMEADFAYRQAFALCPYSPEAVLRYLNFLGSLGRWEDALSVVKIGARLNPKGVGPYEAQVLAQAEARKAR